MGDSWSKPEQIPQDTTAQEQEHEQDMLAYHLIMIASPFGLFCCWVAVHLGGNLQNVVAMTSLALGALTLLWIGSGILSP